MNYIGLKNKFKKLSIIIPVFNEERTISVILKKLIEVELLNGIIKEILIINDCSTDGTKLEIQKFVAQNKEIEIIYFEQTKNLGKGAAIHTGILNATGEYLIVQDADMEYDPDEFNVLLKPILRGVADVVYGSRFMGNSPHRILFFWHSIGNKFLTFLSNAVNNLNLTDMETCYKLFNTELIKTISLKENRFGFEPEITAKISQISGIRIYEVGISYYGRTYEEGKKIRWVDGFWAIFCVFKYGLFKVK